MTSRECENKIKQLIEQLSEEYDCLVVIYRNANNAADLNVKLFGVGCPACSIDLIKSLRDNYNHTGAVKHSIH